MHSIPPSLRLAAIALFCIAGAAHAQTPPALRVIRSLPSSTASPLAGVTVTFDRPVAGSLDRVVDPGAIFRMDPSVPGKLEWRDPVTIRFTPTAPLTPGRTFSVSISNTFRAMDGGALAEPFRFTFRVRGPTLLGAAAKGQTQLTPTHRFDVLYSAPVDLDKLSAAAYVEFSAACQRPGVIRLRATGQRALPAARVDEDEDGDGSSDARLDSLRRSVQLVPVSPMPHGCAGELVIPKETDDPTSGNERVPFATYGDLRISKLLCNNDDPCPRGPFHLVFTTPVRGAEVLRRVHTIPDLKLTIDDTSSEETTWTLQGPFKPRTGYAVVVDTALRDIFGQALVGNPAAGYRTTGVPPLINYAFGHLVIERNGLKTLSVQHVNVDTLVAFIAPIPAALESDVSSRFGWARDSIWKQLMRGVKPVRIAVRSPQDRALHDGVHIPVADARRAGSPTLYAVQVSGRANGAGVEMDKPIAIVQVTNLGVHARIGTVDGAVWVTGANDGLPRPGATVVLYDNRGAVLAQSRTDARGVARLAGWKTHQPPRAADGKHDREDVGEGYVKVTLGDDRAIASITRYDDDLSPWHFNVEPAYGDDRLELAGAVFTERGIYRPGERVFAKAIVRDGPLGALRVPGAGDSLRWRFVDLEGSLISQTTVALSAFGTSSNSLAVPRLARVGQYRIDVQMKRRGAWRSVGRTTYRVAEYRPPEFLVDASAPAVARFPGDTFKVTVQGRYLFGAPMGRAVVGYLARQTLIDTWDLNIPGTDGWYVGESPSWSEERGGESDREFDNGVDTLDARGELALGVVLPAATKGRPSNVTLSVVVTDVNRQNVLASASTIVHPADFYIAAKPRGEDYFWKTGTPQSIDVFAVRPAGEKVSAVQVHGTIVRREWHQVRRERDGESELVGDWVSDTVAKCIVVTATAPTACTFTPTLGGTYVVHFTATDTRGRTASTSFERWATGSDWVPWNDESQFKMDVIPDKTRYSVGDTATLMFASPFTNAEAWITVEREGIIDQRRIHITSGSTTLKFPITEAYAPNAYVSILVPRGRSAKPGPLEDPGRPTLRVGYVNLRVTPEVKRLAVTLAALKPEYRPGDTARVSVKVRDGKGHGVLSEVALWATDEGVLSLTGYKTPDPIDLVYRERGLGVHLASNMTTVAPQVPDGTKGQREPGGGGGAAGADVLRSRFQTTAFFLGSVVTDAQGNAIATAKLPDNLTTFRLMAVAVTKNDRYGKGESKLLVTRPLLARQALPRFMRPADQFTAGAVINRRDGSATTVTVKAQSTGATLSGSADKTVTLAAGRGAEVRFPFVAGRVDSGTFRFDVSGDGYADAVRVSLPVRPDYTPRVHTLAGVVRDTGTAELMLPAGIDPVRSRLSVNVGVSPLPVIRGMAQTLHVYPYDCTEQIVSGAMPILALYRAQRQSNIKLLHGDPRAELQRAVDALSRRQRTDGGIGYWSPTDWSTAWLSAYAGLVLIDARDAGIAVDSSVLAHLADYLTQDLHATAYRNDTPLETWYQRRTTRLSDQVAAVDFLSRFGAPDVASENELIRDAAMLALEDRARLAEVLVRRKQTTEARRLMASIWSSVQVEGRHAVIPDTLHREFYFNSYIRPIARVLTATLAVDPQHALIGPIVETLVQQSRTGSLLWNTQDYGAAVSALAAFDKVRRGQPERSLRLTLPNKSVITASSSTDSSIALTGLLTRAPDGERLRVSLTAGQGAVYYYLAVTEVPLAAPTTPDTKGIRVERWYEKYETGTPVTTVTEGEIVRVRLRITVDATRQFLVLDDALPAGLEAIDLSLRTASALPGPGVAAPKEQSDHEERDKDNEPHWNYGVWDSGWWSPFDHRELRDDRVVYSATLLWPGTYTASYLARATTPGTFIKPPAHAEEMYNLGVNGRSDGGTFIVLPRMGGR